MRWKNKDNKWAYGRVVSTQRCRQNCTPVVSLQYRPCPVMIILYLVDVVGLDPIDTVWLAGAQRNRRTDSLEKTDLPQHCELPINPKPSTASGTASAGAESVASTGSGPPAAPTAP